MRAKYKVILLDLFIGLLLIVTGIRIARRVPLAVSDGALLMLVTPSTTFLLMYLIEHSDNNVQKQILLGAISVAVIGLIASLSPLSYITMLGVIGTGMGGGIVLYRLLFGLLKPVPRARLARFREQSV